MAGGLRFLERGDQIDQRAVVDATCALRRLDCQTDCEVGLAHTGWAEQHYALFAVDEAQFVQALDLLALNERLERELEALQGLHRSQP